MTKRFLITSAVNQAPIHEGFWASIQSAAEYLDAEIVVVATVYKNPTVRGEKKKGDDTYAGELLPHLTRKRRVLGKNLTLCADVPVQPTSGNPLSGLEILVGESSAIVGHCQRALQVVATGRHPRALWTTGACTRPSYSKSRAGARAAAHHVIGALIVEVVGKKFFVRNVTANRDGSFTDLDTTYTPEGAWEAERPLSITAGDYHVGQETPPALKALKALVGDLKPRHLVLHDFLDFATQSHHRQDKFSRFESRNDTVADEMVANARSLADIGTWGAEQTVLVASNHPEHIRSWLAGEPTPQDAELYHKLWAHLYARHRETGRWLCPVETSMRWFGGPDGVKFLRRGESFSLAGTEHGFHGDKGAGGSRGSIRGFARLGCKTTIGHSHTPGIKEGCFQVGVTARLDMAYTVGAPSSWLHAHVVLHADGRRQMVITIGGQYRAQ